MNPSRSLVVRRDDTRRCFVFGDPENQVVRYTLTGKMFSCAFQLRIHRGAYVVPLITGEAMRSLRLVLPFSKQHPHHIVPLILQTLAEQTNQYKLSTMLRFTPSLLLALACMAIANNLEARADNPKLNEYSGENWYA